MKWFLLFGFAFLHAFSLSGQDEVSIHAGNSCLVSMPSFKQHVRLSPPDDLSRNRLDEILFLTNMTEDFGMFQGKVPGAVAHVSGGARFLIVDPDHFANLSTALEDLTAAALLAHQLGHLVQGHPLGDGGTDPGMEMEADHFAGFVLGMLGASQADLEQIVPTVYAKQEGASYPAVEERLYAYRDGWIRGMSRSRDKAEDMAPAAPAQVDGRGYPVFPLPPPDPSARFILPKAYFQGLRELGQVDLLLRDALVDGGYYDMSYYAVPEGFALVTAIEQMDPNTAESLPEPDRWKARASGKQEFSLRDYLAALLFGQKGSFRVFVFVVTPQHFQTRGQADHRQAEAWLRDGLNKLPEQIKYLPLTPAHDCTVLVYEFETHDNGDPTFVEQSRFSCPTHLKQARIMERLGRR